MDLGNSLEVAKYIIAGTSNDQISLDIPHRRNQMSMNSSTLEYEGFRRIDSLDMRSTLKRILGGRLLSGMRQRDVVDPLVHGCGLDGVKVRGSSLFVQVPKTFH